MEKSTNTNRLNIYTSDILVSLPPLYDSSSNLVSSSYEYYSIETHDYHVPALFVLDHLTVYFGEYSKTTSTTCGVMDLIARGIGLIGKREYHNPYKYLMTMCESITQSPITNDGFMRNGAAIDMYCDHTTFGYYKDNEYGNVSLEVYDDYYRFSYHYNNKDGKLYIVQIKVYANGNYDVNHYIDGKIQNRMFAYENGKFLFKDLSLEENVVGCFDNKTKFSFPFKKLYYEREFINYASTGIKPARITEVSRQIFEKHDKKLGGLYDYSGLIKNNYYGGIQTPFVPTWNDKEQKFNSSGYGYGIMPLERDDIYYGHFSNDSMSGPGVLKCSNGNRYLGFYFDNKLSGPCLFLNKNTFKFSTYLAGKKCMEFKIEKDGITLQRYENGSKTDNYSFIEFETFNYYEYDEKNKLVQKFIFDETIATEDVSSDLEELLKKGFECIKDNDGKIHIVKCHLNNTNEIVLPDNIYGIKKEAFSKCSKLKHIMIPKNVCKIEECAFLNCPLTLLEFEDCSNNLYLKNGFSDSCNISNIYFSKRVVRIEKGSFVKCKNLKSVMIDNPCCVVEKGAFPDGCKVLKEVINKETFKREFVDVSKQNNGKHNIEKQNKQPQKVTKKKESQPRKKKVKVDNPNKTNVLKTILEALLKVLSSILIPFKALGKVINKLTRKTETKEVTSGNHLDLILFIIQMLLVSFLIYDGVSHSSEWVLWPVNNIPSLIVDMISNYHMNIFNSLLGLCENSGIIVTILLIIPIILSLILDILIYIFGGIMVLVSLVVFVALTFIIFLSPVALVIYYLIAIIRSDKKLSKFIYFITTLIITVIYFYIMFTYTV